MMLLMASMLVAFHAFLVRFLCIAYGEFTFRDFQKSWWWGLIITVLSGSIAYYLLFYKGFITLGEKVFFLQASLFASFWSQYIFYWMFYHKKSSLIMRFRFLLLDVVSLLTIQMVAGLVGFLISMNKLFLK